MRRHLRAYGGQAALPRELRCLSLFQRGPPGCRRLLRQAGPVPDALLAQGRQLGRLLTGCMRIPHLLRVVLMGF